MEYAQGGADGDAEYGAAKHEGEQLLTHLNWHYTIKQFQYAKILDLPVKRLASLVCCVAGYRAADDKLATLKKCDFLGNRLIWIV